MNYKWKKMEESGRFCKKTLIIFLCNTHKKTYNKTKI